MTLQKLVTPGLVPGAREHGTETAAFGARVSPPAFPRPRDKPGGDAEIEAGGRPGFKGPVRGVWMILAASLALTAPGPAQAQGDPLSGPWVVHGKVGTFAFVLNCTFERQGERIGGVCLDDGTNKRHPLTAGTVFGDRVNFTYQSNYLVTKFDVAFAGVLAGGRMSGTIQVPGHAGMFTAERR